MFLNTTVLHLNDIINWAVDASAFGDLDLECQAILIFIANNQLKNQEVCATDIISHKDMPGSPVTLFNRIHRLKNHGWIISEQSIHHHRKLKLTLSSLSLIHI
jgi:hypothetical protein